MTNNRELVEGILKAMRPDFWPPVWCEWGSAAQHPKPVVEPSHDEKCFICSVAYRGHDIREEGSRRVGRLRYGFAKSQRPSAIHWFVTRE
jgi:hypothetical protein